MLSNLLLYILHSFSINGNLFFAIPENIRRPNIRAPDTFRLPVYPHIFCMGIKIT